MILIRRFLTLAFAASFATTAVAQEGKLNIATVDMQELFKHYYHTNEAQKQINVERARINKDNNERQQKIRDLADSLAKKQKQLEDPSLADSKKQSLYKEWQGEQQEGIALDRERREFLQRKNQQLNEKMVQRMKGILEEIRKLVEEKAKDATDIMAGLLKDLNKDAPPGFNPSENDPNPEIPDLSTPPASGKE